MQLIMDTEPSMDITDKMLSVKVPLENNLKNPVESFKNDITNGNIEAQKNSLDGAVPTVNGDVSSATPILAKIVQSDNEEIVEKGSNENKTEEDAKDIGASGTTNGNGIATIDKSVEDKEIIDNNHNEDESTKSNVLGDAISVNNVDNNLIQEHSDTEDALVKLDGNLKGDTVEVLDNSVEESMENNSPTTREVSVKASECIKPDVELISAVDIVKNNVEETTNDGKSSVEILNIDKDVQVLNVEKEVNNVEVVNVESEENAIKVLNKQEDDNDVDVSINEVDENDVEISNIENRLNDGEVSNIVREVHGVDILNSEAEENDVDLLNTEKEVNDLEVMNIDEVLNTEKETIVDVEMVESSVKDVLKDINVLNVEKNIDTNDTVVEKEVDDVTENDKTSTIVEILDEDVEESTECIGLTAVTESLNKGQETTNTKKVLTENVTSGSENNVDSICDDSVHAISAHTDNSTDNVLQSVNVVANETSRKENKDIEIIFDLDELLKDTDQIVESTEEQTECTLQKQDQPAQVSETKKTSICKLSNTLDILSDDDEEPAVPEPTKETGTVVTTEPTEKQCINIEDDDDIMLIDEDTDSKENKNEPTQPMETDENKKENETVQVDSENSTETGGEHHKVDETLPAVEKDSPVPGIQKDVASSAIDSEKEPETKEGEQIKEKIVEPKKPLVADDFLKGCKSNLADMSRDDLEKFCILKIVEGIVDRSNLSDIQAKLKMMAQNIDEYKKKATMLTKQNRDLQLVLKSVQEEQKKKPDTAITPLKITRSVGMQVLMTEKLNMKRPKTMGNQGMGANTPANKVNNRTPNQSPRLQKPNMNSQQIPVPRLVPANPGVKAPNVASQVNVNNNTSKGNQAGLMMKVNTTPQKTAEKRPHSRAQSVTVDLTDDEPPSKMTPRSSPTTPVRLVSPQNLLARPQFAQTLNSPRKVYIPISGPQGPNIRPGQTIMLKSVPPPGHRLRGPGPQQTAKSPQNPTKPPRLQNHRHPAPLPECMKQYQPPNWKSLPPAPDLKLSKVENGIVISWKIEGYQEDTYEEITDYQIYAYQETKSQPSTSLWKKIGEVKALPLPMACTLTQFMAGYKYYFAVRAVDVRSRYGPFSLPGSILLLSKSQN